MKPFLILALLAAALSGCAPSEPAADESSVVPANSRPDLNMEEGQGMPDSGTAAMSEDEGG